MGRKGLRVVSSVKINGRARDAFEAMQHLTTSDKKRVSFDDVVGWVKDHRVDPAECVELRRSVKKSLNLLVAYGVIVKKSHGLYMIGKGVEGAEEEAVSDVPPMFVPSGSKSSFANPRPMFTRHDMGNKYQFVTTHTFEGVEIGKFVGDYDVTPTSVPQATWYRPAANATNRPLRIFFRSSFELPPKPSGERQFTTVTLIGDTGATDGAHLCSDAMAALGDRVIKGGGDDEYYIEIAGERYGVIPCKDVNEEHKVNLLGLELLDRWGLTLTENGPIFARPPPDVL